MRAVVLLLLVAAIGLGIWALTTGEPEKAPERPEEDIWVENSWPLHAEEILGGSIVGVVLRGGKPVAARVEVLRIIVQDSSNPIAQLMDTRRESVATADVDNDFSFMCLSPGRYRVQASAMDGARGMAEVEITDSEGAYLVEIAILDGSASLTVRAVYADDRPFAGLVAVVPESRERAILTGGACVPANAEGRVVFAGLEPGKVRVRLEIPRVLMAITEAVEVPRKTELLLVIDKGLEPISGKVVSEVDDTPVPGATVQVSSMPAGFSGVIFVGQTDREGRFVLRAGDRAHIAVIADGFEPAAKGIQHRDQEVVVRLVPAGGITGLVTAEGKPRAGVVVYGLPVEAHGMGRPVKAESGADGRYELTDVSNGPIMVFALGGGYASKGVAEVRQQGANPFIIEIDPGSRRKVDLEVEPTGTVRGQVYSDQGTVVPAATVKAHVADGGWGGLQVGSNLDLHDAGTDHYGRYTLTNLAPGLAYRLEVQVGPGAPAKFGPYRLNAGERRTIDLTLPASRHLSVTVLEEGTDAPVKGARVTVSLERGKDWERTPVESTTDAEGKVRLTSLPLGRLAIQVFSDDHVDRVHEVAIPDSEEGNVEYTIRLGRGLPIAGRVLKPDGSPLGRALVRANRVYPEFAFGEHVWTESDGSFRFTGLAAGKYQLDVHADHGNTQAKGIVVKAGTEDVTIRLEQKEGEDEAGPKDLTIRIVDTEGQPVPRGRIIYYEIAPGSRSRSSSDFQNGKATQEVEGDATEYWVIVYNARTRAGKRLAFFIDGPRTPGADTVTLTIPAARSISGTVVDGKGKPVRGVAVRGQPAPDRLPFPWDYRNERVFGVSHSDAEGKFRVEGMGEDDHELHLKPPNTFAPHAPVPAAGGEEGIRIVLKAAAIATVRVLDWADKPVAGARILAMVMEGERNRHWNVVSSETTDSTGRVVLKGLDADGSYWLRVDIPKSRLDLKRYDKEAWRPDDADIRLARAYVVRGVVRTSNGKPVPGVTVWRKEGPGSWGGETTKNDGSFLFTDLDAGPVVLKIENGEDMMPAMPGEQRQRKNEITVQAGDEDVVLTHDPK